MTDAPRKVNYFVRSLITLLCILLSGMILFRYVKVEPAGEITAGMLTILGLLVVLVLAESFDSFSVGKLISISREAKKKEHEVEKLEKQNASLLSQLITISNSQSQRQSSTTVQGDYYESPPVVQRATPAEVEEKQEADSSVLSSTAVEHGTPARARMDWAKAEKIALTKFLDERNIHSSNVITDAKLSLQFDGIDPVSNIQPIFDGYIKGASYETFIDIRPERLISPTYRDRLYMMLSKINYYKVTKKIDAHLDVIVMKIPGEEGRQFSGGSERVFQLFEPAIVSGLLKIHEIKFTEQEALQCREG